MAKLLLLLTLVTFLAATEASDSLLQSTTHSHFGGLMEKMSHLRFFFHDIDSEPNATVTAVARGPTTNASATSFGKINVMDDPLTVGPNLSSKLVGRAQGLYTFASQESVELLMVMNFVFTEKTYNGSTLAVLGRNQAFAKVREMPIVGGSGLFRFARGYVQASTHSFDVTTLYAVVEYNCFVLHY